MAKSGWQTGKDDDIEFNEFKPASVADRRDRVKCSSIHSFRKTVATINKKTMPFFTLLIFANSLILAISTSRHFTVSAGANKILNQIDMAFLVVFTIELVLNFIEHDIKLFKNPWLFFDFFIISVSWLAYILLGPGASNFTILRSLRIMRVLRLIRRIQSLQEIIETIVKVLPEMGSIFLLLFLFQFIFSVLMTDLYADSKKCGATTFDQFTNISRSYCTSWQMMTFDGWTDMMYGMMEFGRSKDSDLPDDLDDDMRQKCRNNRAAYVYSWIPMMIYILVSGFLFMNLIITVIGNSTNILSEQRQAKKKKKLEDSIKAYGADREEVFNVDENETDSHRYDHLQEQMISLTAAVEELSRIVKHKHLGTPIDRDTTQDDIPQSHEQDSSTKSSLSKTSRILQVIGYH